MEYENNNITITRALSAIKEVERKLCTLQSVPFTYSKEAQYYAEESFCKLLDALKEITQITHQINNTREKSDADYVREKQTVSATSSEPLCEGGWETNHIFYCRMDTPPILKKKISRYPFFDFLCRNLNKIAAEAGMEMEKKFRGCTVIYISYINRREPWFPPYYDNDNVAIKAILDAVVPFITADDAAIFCDNIYLTQVSDSNYTELYIVEKGCLAEWKHLHPTLDFASEIG